MDDAIDYFSSSKEEGKIINEDTLIYDTQLTSLSDEEEKNDISSIQNHDPFYNLPNFARKVSNQPYKENKKDNEYVLPLLRRVVPALETSTETCPYEKHDCLKSDVTERIVLLRSLEIVAWVGHMIKLNMLADEPLIQSLILSIYQIGPLYIDPYRLYKFFSINFTILPFSYDDIWTPIDINVVGKQQLNRSSHWRVKMIKIIHRVIRRREGSGPMVHLLLVALCRSLNVCSRLVISFPTSIIIKNAKNCNVKKAFNNFTKVSDLSEEKVSEALKSILLKCPSKQQLTSILKRMNIPDSSLKKSLRRRKIGNTASTLRGSENLEVKFWAEIFSSLHRRWIPVDLVKKSFDTPEAFNLPYKSNQEEANYEKYLPEFAITRQIAIKAENKSMLFTHGSKQALSESLFLTSDLSSSSSISDECEDIVELEQKPKQSEHPKDSGVIAIDNNEIPLSPLNDEDMMLQQKCYAYTFSKCNVKGKASTHSKHSLLTELLDTVSRSTSEKNLDDGLRKSEDSDIFILGCSQYGILRDVTRRYQSKLWPNILEKRKRMGGKNFEFLLKQWNVYLSDTAVQRTTGATDFTLVKATDNLDDYALQEQCQKEALPKLKSLFRHSALYALESLLPFTKIIYPRAPVLGYFYGEPVYPRKNVQEILTRKQWEETKNRIICDGAQPIKVKKKKNLGGKDIGVNDYNEKKLEFFGFWQTKERPSPSVSLDSVPIPIPCSEYETVNLTGNRVVPTGCVHVRGGTAIVSVLRELKTIPWRLALVGFEYGKTLKPVYDGVVVWEKDSILVENRYKEVRKKKLEFLFKQHCERIQKLWMQLVKTILGRYSLAVNEKKYLQDSVSFKYARNAVDQVTQKHFEETRNESSEQASPHELGDPWETV